MTDDQVNDVQARVGQYAVVEGTQGDPMALKFSPRASTVRGSRFGA